MRKKYKGKLNFPTGYPYILFQVSKGKEYKYVLAMNEKEVQQVVKPREKVNPVSVTMEIAKRGHKSTNQLFSQFGKGWMCKENHVFFKQPMR